MVTKTNKCSALKSFILDDLADLDLDSYLNFDLNLEFEGVEKVSEFSKKWCVGSFFFSMPHLIMMLFFETNWLILGGKI